MVVIFSYDLAYNEPYEVILTIKFIILWKCKII